MIGCFYGYLPSIFTDAVDVNLTPDKRKVLVQEEKLLLATVKVSHHLSHEYVSLKSFACTFCFEVVFFFQCIDLCIGSIAVKDVCTIVLCFCDSVVLILAIL